MDPLSYCEEQVLGPRSDFALTRLFAPRESVPALTCLYALFTELARVPVTVTDVGVAQAKLAWWRSELERAYEGGAQHPVAQAVAEHVVPLGPPLEHLRELIAAHAATVDPQPFADYDQLADYGRGMGGAPALLELHICGFSAPSSTEAVAELGLAAALTRFVVGMRYDLRAGRLYVPMDELARFGLTRRQLQDATGGPALEALLGHQIERARAIFERALAQLDARDRYRQRHLLIQAALGRRVLDRAARQGARILSEPPHLGRFHKLVTAWRVASREKRAALNRTIQ